MPRTNPAAEKTARLIITMANRPLAEERKGHSAAMRAEFARLKSAGRGSAPITSMQLDLRLPPIRHHPYQRSP
jgi:hypothetical protein